MGKVQLWSLSASLQSPILVHFPLGGTPTLTCVRPEQLFVICHLRLEI